MDGQVIFRHFNAEMFQEFNHLKSNPIGQFILWIYKYNTCYSDRPSAGSRGCVS